MSKLKIRKTNYEKKKEKIQTSKEIHEYKKMIYYPLILAFILFLCLIIPLVNKGINYKNSFFKVGNISISETEYNYYQNYIVNSWIDNNEEKIKETGLDITKEFNKQQYNDYWTWKEYFEYQTANLIQQTKIFVNGAKEKNFEFNPENKYKEFEKQLKESAKSANINLTTYIKNKFGEKATINELEKIVKEQYLAFAFYEKEKKEKSLSEEELNDYYYENSADYDSVDYRYFSISADEYPDAKQLADNFELEITNEQSFTDLCIKYAKEEDKEKFKDEKYSKAINITKNQLSDEYRSFLFSSREEGDTTVVYNATENTYDIIYFIKRYLDDYDVYSFRQILLKEDSSISMNELKEKWENSDKTEEIFIDYVKKYSQDTSSIENNGLYEKKSYGSMISEINDWLYNQPRKIGDFGSISTSKGDVFIYITDKQEAEWKENARKSIQTKDFDEWLKEEKNKYPITDPNKNLEYLTDNKKDKKQ